MGRFLYMHGMMQRLMLYRFLIIQAIFAKRKTLLLDMMAMAVSIITTNGSEA